jgi:hypothetical protein
MRNQIEPTYLRYIFDGLNNKSIHPDNTSSLPDGFVGLYEEVFDETITVLERQKNIRQFALWAILKKEVSILFISQVLNENEEYIQEFVLKYSKWFNSPEPGKFILYHERLKMYIIQKTNNEVLIDLHRLICNLDNKEDEYLHLFKLDHQIILSFFDSQIYRITKDSILRIEFNQLDSKDLYLAKSNWFKQASNLAGYHNDFSFLKALYLRYNEFISPQISLEEDWKLFELKGVEFLLDRSEDFFLDKKMSYLYLCFYLQNMLSSEITISKDREIIDSLINKLNSYSKTIPNDDNFVLNKYYFQYLNNLLNEKDFSALEIRNCIDDFPTTMFEDGCSILMEEFNILGNQKSEFSDMKKFLTSSFMSIDGISNSIEISSKVIEKLIVLFSKKELKKVEAFINKLKKMVLDSEECSTGDLMSYDSFVFDVFKLISSQNPFYDFASWISLFICSPKLWQQNMSFWKMLVDINFEGSLDEFYRNYQYGSNEMAFEDPYIVDELGFVSLVLSLNERNQEIPILIKKSLKTIRDKNYYNHSVDTLSKSYLIGTVNDKDLILVKNIFYKNDILDNSIFLKQTCELLSKKIDFIDLIDFVYYDYHLQSDVSENYRWSLDIINSIKSKINSEEFLQYVIKGFDEYIKIMGHFSLDEIKHPEDCPTENKWKIEWWVMCNFYASIFEVLKNDEKNLELFKNAVENTFVANGYDSNINLKVGIDRYSIYRKESLDNREFNFEYYLHKNPKHYLMSFKDNMNNKEIISKIAGSIKSGNLNVKN